MENAVRHITIFLLSMIVYGQAIAQLSPGDLTTAHADLEGMRNCTQCHTIGDKVPDEKCLACHTEIESLLNQDRGYHASREVQSKVCIDCHSEHHGRNFDMVRFDEDNFDHDLTGYDLTGSHQRIDCRECHKPDLIEDRELRQRDETYLGLSQECADCHTDYHQATLGTNCTSCHTTEDFSPALRFDHDDAQFALTGQHQDVDCIECHRKETRNGRDFQIFTGLDFVNCNSCHDDPHNHNLGNECNSCHVEQSFSSTSGLNRFNHNQTSFKLKGAHRRINCASCHNLDLSPTAIFQDRLFIADDNCVSCHEDVHDNRFGTSCVDCHTEKSFTEVRLDNFNHGLTDFALLGLHQTVDCRECHTTDLTDPLEHNACAACHTDYHEGEFVRGIQSPDCAECHSETGFEIPLFSIDDHNNKTEFPLDGAHLATPCFACHLSDAGDQWQFRNIGERCVDCHDDVHEGYISEEYYPQKTCENCHLTDSWTANIFDHSQTEFELKGVHAEQACMACHGNEEEEPLNRYVGFSDISTDCISCHQDTHEGQFAEGGQTDCARCHGFDSWDGLAFDHDRTNFPLEGKHAEIDCEACHKPIEENGQIYTQYKFADFSCAACHQ